MKITSESALRDTLYNASLTVTRNTQHEEYGRGVVVGVVGTIMAVDKYDFKTAVRTVVPFLPNDINWNCVPESWHLDFREMLEKLR